MGEVADLVHADGRPMIPRAYYWPATYPARPWRGYMGTSVISTSYGLCPGQHRTEAAAVHCARREIRRELRRRGC